jgi:hypothetical protein
MYRKTSDRNLNADGAFRPVGSFGSYLWHTDPDPVFHFDADPDPDPTLKDAALDPDPTFHFDRIRILALGSKP